METNKCIKALMEYAKIGEKSASIFVFLLNSNGKIRLTSTEFDLTEERIKQIGLEVANRLLESFMDLVVDYTELKLEYQKSKMIPKLYKEIIESKLSGFLISETQKSIKEQNYLLVKVSELNVETRTINVFNKEGIEFLGDLMRYSKRDLLNLRNMGRKSLVELEEELYVRFGIKLKDE